MKIFKIFMVIILVPLTLYIGTIAYRNVSSILYSRELIGVRKTGLYHRDNCILLKDVQNADLIFFKNLQVTAEYGYRPCKSCNPPSNKKEIKLLNAIIEKEIIESEEKKKSEDIIRQQQILIQESQKESERKEYEEMAQNYLNGAEIGKEMLSVLLVKGYISQNQIDEVEMYRILEKAMTDYYNGKQIGYSRFAGLINKGMIPKKSIMYINVKEFEVQVESFDLTIPITPNKEEIDEIINKGYVAEDIKFFKRVLDIDKERGNSLDWYSFKR